MTATENALLTSRRRVQVGPLIIHPLVYHFPTVFYGGHVQHSVLQK